MSDKRTTRHGHTIERGKDPGSFKITLDRRAGSLGIGSVNDPYLIAELMACDAILAETRAADKLEEMRAEEPGVVVPPSASREERRIAELQNIATDQASLDRFTKNEGLPRTEFRGNPERARARRRLRERRATYHTGSALERVAAGIRSFADTVADIVSGAIYERHR